MKNENVEDSIDLDLEPDWNKIDESIECSSESWALATLSGFRSIQCDHAILTTEFVNITQIATVFLQRIFTYRLDFHASGC
jgi:hypothetical protein